MKLSDFHRVEALAAVRNHLDALRTGRIEISINGQYQSREFVDAVAPAVRLELRHQIVEFDEKLLDLGVTIE